MIRYRESRNLLLGLIILLVSYSHPGVAGVEGTQSPTMSSSSQSVEYGLTLPGASRELVELAEELLVGTGLPPELVHTLVYVESGWDVSAVSGEGAVGLMQVTPLAVVDASQYCGITPAPTGAELLVPRTNLRIGICYLQLLLDRYGRNWYNILVAYHGGHTAVSTLGRGERLGVRTANYALRILYLVDTSSELTKGWRDNGITK